MQILASKPSSRTPAAVNSITSSPYTKDRRHPRQNRHPVQSYSSTSPANIRKHNRRLCLHARLHPSPLTCQHTRLQRLISAYNLYKTNLCSTASTPTLRTHIRTRLRAFISACHLYKINIRLLSKHTHETYFDTYLHTRLQSLQNGHLIHCLLSKHIRKFRLRTRLYTRCQLPPRLLQDNMFAVSLAPTPAAPFG